LRWTEQLDVLAGTLDSPASIPVELHGEKTELKLSGSSGKPSFVLPTGGGIGYGDFTLDESSRAQLLQRLPDLSGALTRGAAWVTLWEEMLDRRVRPLDFVNLALTALPKENTEQNIQLTLGYLGDTFWTFLSDTERKEIAPRLEQVLRTGLDQAKSSTTKSTYFSAFRSTVTTPDGVAFLERVWRKQENIPGLKLAEPDEAAMALELAVRSVPGAQSILEEQRGRFMNPDRKARFEFVMPALSENPGTREAWFAALKDVNNRRREPWVLEGLSYLHHPLRAAQSEKYIRPSLDLLIDIQRTGDIFFPTRWTNAVLAGHNTGSAAQTVRTFLHEQKDYPIRLRRIILQAADELFRASGG
jgi:aminopeptidase N